MRPGWQPSNCEGPASLGYVVGQTHAKSRGQTKEIHDFFGQCFSFRLTSTNVRWPHSAPYLRACLLGNLGWVSHFHNFRTVLQIGTDWSILIGFALIQKSIFSTKTAWYKLPHHHIHESALLCPDWQPDWRILHLSQPWGCGFSVAKLPVGSSPAFTSVCELGRPAPESCAWMRGVILGEIDVLFVFGIF